MYINRAKSRTSYDFKEGAKKNSVGVVSNLFVLLYSLLN